MVHMPYISYGPAVFRETLRSVCISALSAAGSCSQVRFPTILFFPFDSVPVLALTNLPGPDTSGRRRVAERYHPENCIGVPGCGLSFRV